MSQPLTPKNEHALTSSGLLSSSIITLAPVSPLASAPPVTTNRSLLPCEPRFLIRLVDDPQGNSRWTTPEAARDAESGSRFLPPYHPASRSVQGALEARAAHAAAVRYREEQLRLQAEADWRKQQAQIRPIFVIANAAEGTAGEYTRLTSPGAGEEDGGEDEAAQQPAGEEEAEAEEGSAGGVDADSMKWVGASCQRCIQKKTRCNRRRPCQFCLQDGVGEEGCALPRGSDSPELAVAAPRNSSEQASVPPAGAPVATNPGETPSAHGKRKRDDEAREVSGKYQCPPVPLHAFNPFTPPPGTFPVPPAAIPPRSAFMAPPAHPAPAPAPAPSTRPPPPTASYPSILPPNPAPVAAPTQPAPSTTNTTKRRGGKRGNSKPKKPSSPRPYRGQNFLTEEQEKQVREWDERHKDD
ncbi:hypothetical protein M409DRAFT_58206 [Zasmidium cellare ATCC 36951]|uniref:Zn(2)-C6 fungal-type domain-containing protein n=1 Tax=Zasmidium cellare ATCC 36951 TaxID=1080233 RepID=A0A6A6CAF8_ZASCE|nr:uncharacterized protein M409DRAFT_58206 [Zasmidium cellare ATCC 36951]KAF2162436.1 hypothetical protein M409DRAFT_58206 [Zasmidium cellare ATCC 36951]